MRRFLLPILMIVSPAALAGGNAPLCVFSGATGAQCTYYDMQSCQSAARTFQGMCAPNQQAQQQTQPAPATPAFDRTPLPTLELPNLYETWSRAREDGSRRAEQERRRAPAPPPAVQSTGKFSWDGFIKDLAYRQHMRGPIYDCGNGPTPVPAEGCTVLGFEREL